MVRVALRLAEGAEQPAQLVGIAARRFHREVGSAERWQQLEACLAKLPSPSQVDGSVRGEPLEQCAERGRSDVIKGAEHRDTPHRLTIEDVGIMRSSGVVSELRQRRRAATDHDDAVVRGVLDPQVRAEVLSRSFVHVTW